MCVYIYIYMPQTYNSKIVGRVPTCIAQKSSRSYMNNNSDNEKAGFMT